MSRHAHEDEDQAVTSGPVPKMTAKFVCLTVDLTEHGGNVCLIVTGPAKGSQAIEGWRTRFTLYEDEASASSSPTDAVEGICHAVLEALKGWESVRY